MDPLFLITVRCPYLCDPHNGLAFYDHDRRVGTVATFDCFPEYELSDTNEIICGASGDWSNPSPVCTPVGMCLINVTPFRPPDNGS